MLLDRVIKSLVVNFGIFSDPSDWLSDSSLQKISAIALKMINKTNKNLLI